MPSTEQILAYARNHAAELRADMRWEQSGFGNGGWWTATDKELKSRIAARAAAAIEFLRQYAGEDSHWTAQASAIYLNKGDGQSAETGARAVGDMLEEWARQVEAGILEIAGARAWQEVAVVSTDVMGQVQALVSDRNSHPAAPIVLCGAALEIALRAVVDARQLQLDERPSLGAYTRLLRRERLITAQDVKDLEQCAGLRNSAAHGDFDSLSRERAGLMEQQTNLLLRRLADLHP
ncbi:hypothetical protein [Lentzea sp. NPDC059081]|uniref:hypothetical protein n=1 Tax=Lentzea sp. NPDC059081 TaxID=3346719 RepID=UPI003673D8CD